MRSTRSPTASSSTVAFADALSAAAAVASPRFSSSFFRSAAFLAAMLSRNFCSVSSRFSLTVARSFAINSRCRSSSRFLRSSRIRLCSCDSTPPLTSRCFSGVMMVRACSQTTSIFRQPSLYLSSSTVSESSAATCSIVQILRSISFLVVWVPQQSSHETNVPGVTSGAHSRCTSHQRRSSFVTRPPAAMPRAANTNADDAETLARTETLLLLLLLAVAQQPPRGCLQKSGSRRMLLTFDSVC
ncbi:hypothetical protein, conserved [Leishmania tarentolae]|uniref:Uncharacterized protein n=1 Tax=Leishmania tarentolae TaxID=5689 RepID=A0A640KCV3_LEITA|nr:hypothetical protein, conserved [Leishmania tarentolae]